MKSNVTIGKGRSLSVMAGLVPAIYASTGKERMAGTIAQPR
jgi:hypothetical protein